MDVLFPKGRQLGPVDGGYLHLDTPGPVAPVNWALGQYKCKPALLTAEAEADAVVP